MDMIRNVGRSCRRLILIDLVRGWIPFSLFQIFIAPFVSAVTASDGKTSIRRAYTVAELRALVERTLQGTDATFRHHVAALNIRRIVDITYEHETNPRDQIT
jgi:hypothetical protein